MIFEDRTGKCGEPRGIEQSSFHFVHSHKGHVTNEKVRRKILAAIGEYDELLTLVKKRKQRWFCHVSRSSCLANTILQNTVKGKRRVGRQKKRWEDNIKERTEMGFASSTRAAENRDCFKFFCGVPMTFQGYRIELKIEHYSINFEGSQLKLKITSTFLVRSFQNYIRLFEIKCVFFFSEKYTEKQIWYKRKLN